MRTTEQRRRTERRIYGAAVAASVVAHGILLGFAGRIPVALEAEPGQAAEPAPDRFHARELVILPALEPAVAPAAASTRATPAGPAAGGSPAAAPAAGLPAPAAAPTAAAPVAVAEPAPAAMADPDIAVTLAGMGEIEAATVTAAAVLPRPGGGGDGSVGDAGAGEDEGPGFFGRLFGSGKVTITGGPGCFRPGSRATMTDPAIGRRAGGRGGVRASMLPRR